MPITILIFAQFLRNLTCACMILKMKNIDAQNQSSIYFSCIWKVIHNKLFEEPSYLNASVKIFQRL